MKSMLVGDICPQMMNSRIHVESSAQAEQSHHKAERMPGDLGTVVKMQVQPVKTLHCCEICAYSPAGASIWLTLKLLGKNYDSGLLLS